MLNKKEENKLITELDSLKEKGILTEDEYNEKVKIKLHTTSRLSANSGHSSEKYYFRDQVKNN